MRAAKSKFDFLTMLNACGGPALPAAVNFPDGMVVDYPGMTLRDYFAASALQCMVGDGNAEKNALSAYEQADAMLEARKK